MTPNLKCETRRQVAPPFWFTNPESFYPGEFFRSPKLRLRCEDARYFISLILRKLAQRDVDHLGLVRLHAKHLNNIMHQVFYAAVIEALLEGGAVERFPYLVGARSFGFRLAARFIGDQHLRVPATDPRIINRMVMFHELVAAERRERMKPVHHLLAERQRRLKIHGNKAREILAGLPSESNPYDTQGILIADIEDRDFHVNVGNYGRLANNITNLKRELSRHAARRKSTTRQRRPVVCSASICLEAHVTADQATKAGRRTRTRAHRPKEPREPREPTMQL